MVLLQNTWSNPRKKILKNYLIWQEFTFSKAYNQGQNIWHKVKTKNIIRQDQKTLTVCFYMSHTRFRMNWHSLLLEYQGASCSKQAWYLKFKWLKRDSNPQWLSLWPVWLNGCVFVYNLSGCGFESHCSHLKNFDTCFFIFVDCYCKTFISVDSWS